MSLTAPLWRAPSDPVRTVSFQDYLGTFGIVLGDGFVGTDHVLLEGWVRVMEDACTSIVLICFSRWLLCLYVWKQFLECLGWLWLCVVVGPGCFGVGVILGKLLISVGNGRRRCQGRGVWSRSHRHPCVFHCGGMLVGGHEWAYVVDRVCVLW